MVDTFHQVPGQRVGGNEPRLVGTELRVVDAGERADGTGATRGLTLRARRGAGGALLFVATAAASTPLWHWAMTYEGPGHVFSLATDLLVAAMVALFVVPEVFALWRWRARRALARRGNPSA